MVINGGGNVMNINFGVSSGGIVWVMMVGGNVILGCF